MFYTAVQSPRPVSHMSSPHTLVPKMCARYFLGVLNPLVLHLQEQAMSVAGSPFNWASTIKTEKLHTYTAQNYRFLPFPSSDLNKIF